MRRKGTLWITLGLLLIAASACLTMHNLSEELQAEQTAATILVQLLPEILDNEVPPAAPEHPAPDTSPDMAARTVDGGEYIAVLSIPALKLELPVCSSWDYTRLQAAPCRYSGSIDTNDLVICAHNYSGHFGSIKRLSVGDSVILVGMDGSVYSYAVEEVEVLRPEAVEDMLHGDWDLTLFTCTVGGAARVTVRCSAIHPEPKGD